MAVPDPNPVDGIVLAAGRSERMGAPKPLLELDGRTFLERTVEALRQGGCRRVVVVAPQEPARVKEAAVAAGAHVVVNRQPRSQQIESLRLGLEAIGPDAVAVVVLPVDHPLVRPVTVEALIAAFRARRRPLVRAALRGVPGHPTLFARELFPELASDDLPRGAETVVKRDVDRIEDVPVDDPGVTADIDGLRDLHGLDGTA